jgi:hypothetical protein
MSYFEQIYNLFFNPGEVTEIRAFGLSKGSKAWEGGAGGAGIVYGYFDNPKDFAKAAAMEQAMAPGIYFTLNPVIPDLLARAANRLKAAGTKSITTSDKDILCIRWLPIDLDPKRPAGIWKLFGTTGRKGDHIEERPHRKSCVDQTAKIAEG